MSQPLTDAINALTTYANTVTGKTPPDTTLSDAVATLASGYGQGGGANYLDFSAGNIKALIFNGTEYIETDYMGEMANLFAIKIMSNAVKSYEHFFGMCNGNNKTGIQRNNVNWNTTNVVCSNSSIGRYTFALDTDATFVIAGFGTNSAMVCTKPLCIGAGYWNGNLEAQRTKMHFYGLNVMDINQNIIARFMPWLENGTPCVKDLVTGNIFYNAGTGTFGYIDSDGNIH